MDLQASAEFAAWYEHERPRVLGALYAFSGDLDLSVDATDEAFTRALARWSRVSRMTSPAGWTYRVALNELRRGGRRRQRERQATPGVAVQAVRAPGTDAEIWEAVRALPTRQRTVVVLRYVADLPEAAIAEAMGIRRGTVASNLADARRNLARFLSDDDTSSGSREARR